MKRILFVSEAGESACTEMRAEIPAVGLRQLGYDVDVTSVVFENADGMLYGFDPIEGKQLSRPHVVVVRHTVGPNGEQWDSQEMYRKARKKGQRIFFDVDDDFWNLPDWNPASQWMTSDVIQLIEHNINACDGLIVSTEAIAVEAAKHVDVPIHIALNGVQPERYQPRWDERTPLRLGWFGGTNWRRPDIESVADALNKALAGRYGEVEFWHIGWQEGQPSIRDILGADFPVEIVEYPWVPLRLVPWAMTMIDCAVIPQPEHVFSEARSNVMGLRMSAAGVCWAATSTAEYRRLFTSGAGYLVDEPSAWEQAIHVLCDPFYEEARRNIRVGGVALARRRNEEWAAQQYVSLFGEVPW